MKRRSGSMLDHPKKALGCEKMWNLSKEGKEANFEKNQFRDQVNDFYKLSYVPFSYYIKHLELGEKGYIWQMNLGLRFGYDTFLRVLKRQETI